MSQPNPQGHRQLAPKTNGHAAPPNGGSYIIDQRGNRIPVETVPVHYAPSTSRAYQVPVMQAVHAYPGQIVVSNGSAYAHNIQPIQVSERGRIVQQLPQNQHVSNDEYEAIVLDASSEDGDERFETPPVLDQMNVEISEEEAVRSDSDFDEMQRLIFMEEAARFRKSKEDWENRIVVHDYGGFLVEESDDPIKPFKAPKRRVIAQESPPPMVDIMEVESDELEEDRDEDFVPEAPAPRGRGRGRGRGSRGGRGGRGGRRGGRRSWARDREEDSGNDDSFDRESHEEVAPVEEETQMKELQESPSHSGQEVPLPKRKKRDELAGLMSFDHGPHWAGGVTGERRRSTLEDREREREKEREANAPKTRQKRRNTTESNSTDKQEPPAKKSPEKKEALTPEEPTSPKKPPGFCRRCGEPIKVPSGKGSEKFVQYCSKKCRKLQLRNLEEPSEDEERREYEEQDTSSESQGPSESGTVKLEKMDEQEHKEEEDIPEPELLPVPHPRFRDFKIPTSSEFAAKSIKATLLGQSARKSETPGEVSSPSGSPVSNEAQSPADESPRAMMIPKKEGEERRSSSEPLFEEPIDEMWSVEYAADVIANAAQGYAQKEDLKKRCLDLELDGYFLAHSSMDKKTLKTLLCISLGPAVTLAPALQRRQPKKKELRDAFRADPATIQTVEETAQWITDITNDDCANLILANELDLISLALSKIDELVELGMKYGKAYKITHILDQNRKSGIVYDIPALPESFMNEKLQWTTDQLAQLLQQYIPEKCAENLINEGIDINLLYNMNKEDFSKELALPFGPAKIMAKMMQHAREAGGKPREDYSKLGDNVVEAPKTSKDIQTWIHQLVKQSGVSTEAERKTLEDAEIDADMFFHLSLDSLMKNLGIRYAVAKIIMLSVYALKNKGWGPSPASDPLCADFLKKTRHWSVDDTADWMRSYCSEKVAEKMREAGIDGEALPFLTINGLMEFLNLSFNDALKIMTKFKYIKSVLDSEELNTPLPSGEITTSMLFDWLQKKISGEAVEKLAENGMEASFFSHVTMKDLVGKMGLRFIDALKLAESVKKIILPSCIAPVDTDFTLLDKEQTKEWLEPIVGEEEYLKLYSEDFMGKTLDEYNTPDEFVQDVGLKYGSAVAIVANVNAARSVRSSL